MRITENYLKALIESKVKKLLKEATDDLEDAAPDVVAADPELASVKLTPAAPASEPVPSVPAPASEPVPSVPAPDVVKEPATTTTAPNISQTEKPAELTPKQKAAQSWKSFNPTERFNITQKVKALQTSMKEEMEEGGIDEIPNFAIDGIFGKDTIKSLKDYADAYSDGWKSEWPKKSLVELIDYLYDHYTSPNNREQFPLRRPRPNLREALIKEPKKVFKESYIRKVIKEETVKEVIQQELRKIK